VGHFRAGRRQLAALSKVAAIFAVAPGLWVSHAHQPTLLSSDSAPPSPLTLLLGSSAQPARRSPRPLEELPHSVDTMIAANVIEFNVERFHQDWDTLAPINRDDLCVAGRAIRSTMHRYNNTLADLNHMERAIYEITAPAGRCSKS
jgi:hypothetical protein